MVWAIGSQDSYDNLGLFAEQMGLTYPVLFDDGGAAHADYNPGKPPPNSIYREDWFVGVHGKIV